MPVNISVKVDQAALVKSINQAVSKFNGGVSKSNKLKLDIDTKSFSQPLGRITADLDDFEKSMKASNARVLAFGASAVVLGGVAAAFRELADSTIQVEKNITDLNRVLNLSASGIASFSSELFNVAKQTAVSFNEAAQAATEFSRQGLGAEETLKRTKDALILVRLAGVDSARAVQDLTAAVNGFSKEGLTTEQILNKIVAVEQAFAVSAQDLTQALSRSGQAAQEAGVGFDELNALVAAAQETTARGGPVIGNALKTIFTRLQRSSTLNQLEKFNVEVRNIQGNILPAGQILKNFADVYKDLGSAQKAYLSEQIAGVYQVNILKALINDLNKEQGVYNEGVSIGASATNEANIAKEKLNKTLSALIAQTGTGIQQLSSNIGDLTFKPIFKSIVEPFNDAINYINGLLEGEGIGNQFAEGILKGVRNILAGPGLVAAVAVILKVAKSTFGEISKAVPALLEINTASSARANIEKTVLAILQSQGDVSQELTSLEGNREKQAELLLKIATQTTEEYREQKQLAEELSRKLSGKGVVVGSRGLQTGRRIRNSDGYIPSFASSEERKGALRGGYSPGAVIPSPVGGVMNTAEEVRYVAGYGEPFINPPEKSNAGRLHRKNSMMKTGIDPYANFGFIPNFQKTATEYPVLDVSKGKRDSVTMLVPQQIGNTTDLYKFAKEDKRKQFGIGGVKYPVSGLNKNSSQTLKNKNSSISDEIDNSLVGAGKLLLDQFDPEFIKSKAFTESDLDKLLAKGGASGARDSLKGAFFEGIVSKILESKNADEKPSANITYDTVINSAVQDLFDGPPTTQYGDYKRVFSIKNSDTRKSFVEQILKNHPQTKSNYYKDTKVSTKRRARRKPGFKQASALGFIPNFADKDKVMKFEEAMSGEKAVYSEFPFPHVRNTSQPSFYSAVNDHGGINKAMEDSLKSQMEAGLINKGYIPNFNIRGPKGGFERENVGAFGTRVSKLAETASKNLVNNINSLLNSYREGKITQDQLNDSSQQLLKENNITSEQRKNLSRSLKRQITAIDKNTTATNQGTSAGVQGILDSPIGQTKFGGFLAGQVAKSEAKGGRLAKINNFSQRFSGSGASLALGLIGPAIGGGIEQAITGGKSRSELSFGQRFAGSAASSVLTAGSTGALIGSAILPGLGTAVGAAVGAIGGLAAAALNASDKLEDLQESSERLAQENTEQLNAIDKIIELTKQIQSGNNPTGKSAKDLAEERAGLIATLADRTKNVLDVANFGDVAKIEENLQELRRTLADEERIVKLEQLKFIDEISEAEKKSHFLRLVRLSEEDERLKEVLDGIRAVGDEGDITKVFRSESFKGLDKRLQEGLREAFSNLNLSLVNVDEFGGGARAAGPNGQDIGAIVEKTNLDTLKEVTDDYNTGIKQAGEKGKNDVAGNATRIFERLNLLLQGAAILVDQEVTRGTNALKLKEAANKFSISIRKGIEDPLKLIQDDIDAQKAILQEQYNLARKKALSDFDITFVKAAENIAGQNTAKKIEQLILGGATAEDLIRQISSLKAVGGSAFGDPAQREQLLKIARDFLANSDKEALNLKGQKELLDLNGQQLQFQARLQQDQERIISRLEILRSIEQRGIEASRVDNEINQTRRNLALQDPTAFFGKTVVEEAEQRIQARRQTVQENLDISRRQSLAEGRNVAGKIQATLSNLTDRFNQIAYEQRGSDKAFDTGNLAAEFDSAREDKIFDEDYQLQEKDLQNLIKKQEKLVAEAKKYTDGKEESTQLVRKLETDLEQLKSIEQGISLEVKKQNAVLAEQEERERRMAKLRGTARYGFADAVSQIKREAETFPETFTRDTTFAFRDGLVSAMDAAANSTGSLRESLLNVVADFARSIQQAMFTQVANQIVGSFPIPSFGQKGGIIKAQNGMYISGGRTGDRNLALLEDGEYVLNRKAVKGLGGPSSLDKLNFGKFPRFASGGETKIKEKQDIASAIDDSSADASAFVNLSATDPRLSSFAMENTPFIKKYYDQKRRELEERRRRRAAKKAQKRQLLASAITTAVGFGVSGLMSGAFSAAKPMINASTGFTEANISAAKNLGFTDKALIQFQDAGVTLNSSGIPNMQTGGRIKFNSGGYVPYGNRITDSVPAMLTGGEYVVNSNAVRKYGVGGLNRINSGVARFQDGGPVGVNMGGDSSTSVTSTNNIGVNITVNNQAGGASSETTEDKSSGNSSKNERERYKEFSAKVKEAVTQVIVQEQRVGGLLDGTKKRTQ